MKNDRIEKIISLLQLKPLPDEGGLFFETYRSEICLVKECLPADYQGGRNISTAIYYMLTNDPVRVSKLHCLKSDEIYHFYLGDPVEMMLLYPDGSSGRITLGQNIFKGQYLQFVVPKGTWQGSYLLPGGDFALMGTTVSPGFDFSDTQLGVQRDLIHKYPDREELIKKLT